MDSIALFKRLVCIAGMLLCVGLIFIYSASSVYAAEKCGSAFFFLKKQIIGLFIGIVGAAFIQRIPSKKLYKFAPFIFIITLALTALTFIPGLSHTIHGSSRWLKLWKLSFQPSELLKVSFVLFVAYFLTKKEYAITSLTKTFLPLLSICGIAWIILLKQPDFGLTVTLCLTLYALMFLAGIPGRFLLGLVGAALPAFLLLVITKSYRLKRILVFLDPWADPQGSGFQIIQSLIAMGSGGWLGVGIGQSKQKLFYLPMQHTDFIFSIIAEETGFIGIICLIALFLWFVYTGCALATKLSDRFAALATVGFMLIIAIETAINCAVACGLVPTKGIGMPFISYGNSSLIAHLLMIGIIGSFVRSERHH